MQKGMRFTDLPDQIQSELTILLCDKFTNLDNNEINWNFIEQLKENCSTDKTVSLNYNIGYIICKSNV